MKEYEGMREEIFYGTLPKPLSNNEIREYFEKYRLGDISARNIIIKHNIRLVLKIVSTKYSSVPCEGKDLMDVGLLALIKCIDCYDLNKDFSFSSYATRAINNAIINYIRDYDKKTIRAYSYDKIIESTDDGLTSYVEGLKDSTDIIDSYETKERNEKIKEIIYGLDEREKTIILLYFGFIDDKKYTYSDLGEMYNVSGSNIGLIIKKALKKIKYELCVNDIGYFSHSKK